MHGLLMTWAREYVGPGNHFSTREMASKIKPKCREKL